MTTFTPEEANAALAAVRPLAETLVRARRRFLAATAGLERLRGRVAGNGAALDSAELSTLEDERTQSAAGIAAALAELESLGVQVKDLDRGLVDFPAVHPADGRTVLLCWQVGEEAVSYWHGLDEGFAGRKALPF